MIELNRFLRHLIAPLTAWAVAGGILPEYMQSDITELAVLVVAFGIPYGLSWYRDKNK
jgi:hypothetical protein